MRSQGSRQRLVDVLEELPLDDFKASTWASLSRQDRHSFRRVCKQTRTLTEQLTTSTHHNLHPARPRPADGNADSQAALQEEGVWHRAATHHAAFLSRLPRLASLKLSCWPNESALASELLLCGTATQGRVTALDLAGKRLSLDSIRAVRLAFPQLRALSLAAPRARQTARRVTVARLDLQGPLFLPLHGMLQLTELSVKTGLDITAEALRSLAGLAPLTHLDLTLLSRTQDAADLLLLTGIRGLEHCSIRLCGSEPTLPHFAPLLAATRLTHLKLLGVAGRGVGLPQEDPPSEAHAAALAALGDLSGLQSLHLWDSFEVDSAARAALRRLTRLTELCVGEIVPLAPGARPAHLPLLQQLHIGRVRQRASLDTLRQLLPLLPLPSLVGLNGGALRVEVGDADSDAEGEDGPSEWSATLHAVLDGLASSPLLGHAAGVTFTSGDNSSQTCTVAQIAAHLRPTAPGLLAFVCLESLELKGCPWGVLHACWPGLRRLRLLHCDLSLGTLAALVGGMRTLQRLDLHCCWWARKEEEEGVGWVVAAAHCSRPLQVKVGPVAVPAEVRLRCGAVQQVLFGVQTIDWLD